MDGGWKKRGLRCVKGFPRRTSSHRNGTGCERRDSGKGPELHDRVVLRKGYNVDQKKKHTELEQGGRGEG